LAELTVNISPKLRDLIRNAAERLPSAAQYGAVQAAYSLRAFMVDQYLSGTRVKVQTGKLRSGWFVAPIPGGAVVGTATEYAAALEFGFNGTVNVPEHQRRTSARRGGSETKAAFKERKTAMRDRQYAGRLTKDKASGYATVRAHAMRMNVRPRFYVRDTVRFGNAQAMRVFRAAVAERVGSGN